MMTRKIEIHIQALASLLKRDRTEFSDFRSFNDYKKQQIKAYRNQLLADQLKCLTTDLQFSKHEYGKPFLNMSRSAAQIRTVPVRFCTIMRITHRQLCCVTKTQRCFHKRCNLRLF